MAGIFDKNCEKYDRWYEKNRFAYLSEMEAIKKVLPPTGKGLEVGVGTGRFAAPLKIEFGIDPSEGMLEIARQRGINVKKGSGENLPFGDAEFDYVAFIITICFIRNPQKALREAHRVLKEGGSIIIGIVDRNSFLGRFYQSKESVFYKEATFFTADEITGFLVSEGFGDFVYWQTLFEMPDRMDRVQEPEKGFDKGGFTVIAAKVLEELGKIK